jgi:succinyl-diaminopimelate desuccinylase
MTAAARLHPGASQGDAPAGGSPLEPLFDRIDALREDLVALTQDLVRIPTVNPPGDAYQPCAEFVGQRLRRHGYEVEYHRGLGERGDNDAYPRLNVLGRLAGRRPGPTIHFNSHIDVVEVGQGWTVDPFAGVVKDGRVYGRGTCDMKGGMAASMIAIEAILAEGIDFPGAFEISGTVDEESGGFAGVGYLAKRGYFSKPRVDYVIIPEPLHKDCVCLGHRGVWWAEVETLGRIAHGSMPFLGVSAIRSMTRFLEKIESKLYPALERRETAMPVIPALSRRSTLNINSIHGGQAEIPRGSDAAPSPLVADSCRVMLDRRYLIEELPEQVEAEIVGLLEECKQENPQFRYAVREILHFPPNLTAADSPLVAALDAGIARVLGKASTHVVSPGTYDQKHVQRVGLLKDCVAYGPGILDLAHQPDEYVGIDDMLASAKVMAAASLRLMGLAAP